MEVNIHKNPICFSCWSVSKNEAKKLADKGLQFHKDLFTGKWKRRRYYLRDDWDGNNTKLLNEIRGNKVK